MSLQRRHRRPLVASEQTIVDGEMLGEHRFDLLVLLDEGEGRMGREQRQRVAANRVTQLLIGAGEHHLPVQIDFEPLKGGIVNVVAEDVEQFDLRFFDPMTGMWVESWDSMQVSGQPNRLPLEVEIILVLKGVGGGDPYSYRTKVFLPIQQPLSFGVPRQ